MTRLCFVVLVLILSACGSGSDGGREVRYEIVPGEPGLPEGSAFSDLVAEYRYIVPETTPESLFGYISKVCLDRGCLYVFEERRGMGKILVFDAETGKFLRATGSVGRGPGEYTSAYGFTLDRDRRELLVVDRAERKVFVYDADSGSFKRSFDVGFSASNIEYVDSSTLAFEVGGADEPNKLTLTDMEGRVLGSYIAANDKNSGQGVIPFSRGDGDEVLYHPKLSDSLFTVTPSGPVFSRFVDFGADALTMKAYMAFPRKEQTGTVDNSGLKNYKTDIRYWSETESHIWFFYADRGVPAIVLRNKLTGGVVSYPSTTGNDLVFDKMPLLVVGSDGEWFIGTNDAYSIADNIAETTPADVPDDLRRLTENNNPVISFVKFK
jgi:hypothetical protein